MKRIAVLLVGILIFVGAVSVQAGDPDWSFVKVLTTGCGSGQTEFLMHDGDNFDPSYTRYLTYRTVVEANGKIYMNQDFIANFLGYHDLYWFIYPDNSAGPTTADFPLPAHTRIDIQFTLLDGSTPLTTFSYILWDCSGAPNECAPLPPTAVVGHVLTDTVMDWAPGKGTEPHATLLGGQSVWVLGVDDTGKYYQVWWSCQTLWVPVESLGPNYDQVWQGRPLPIGNVSPEASSTTSGKSN